MSQLMLAKYASMITRGSNRFFDHALAPYGIGCGQQFFLVLIAQNEGLSMYDLACLGKFDKATVTRAIQKLAEGGFIICQVDENDRRVRRLHTTAAAKPLLDHLHTLRCEWDEILTRGVTPDELELAGAVLEKIAKNAFYTQSQGELNHE